MRVCWTKTVYECLALPNTRTSKFWVHFLYVLLQGTVQKCHCTYTIFRANTVRGGFVFKINYYLISHTLIPQVLFIVIKMNNFLGDFTDRSAKTTALAGRFRVEWFSLLCTGQRMKHSETTQKPAHPKFCWQLPYEAVPVRSECRRNVVLSADSSNTAVQEIYGIMDASNGADADGESCTECVVCLTNPKNTTVLPCRHFCMCSDCARALLNQSKKCPMCRLNITSVLQINIALPAARPPVV